jgi:hypothetical protein
VKLISFGCKRFNSLVNEREDRDLSPQEEAWITDHQSKCAECRKTQDSLSLSLNMLRAATLDVEPERGFDRRLIRRVRVQAVKESFSYWLPALVGCLIAFFAIFSTLDLLATRGGQSSVKVPTGQARRNDAYPLFELNQPIHLDR